MKTGISLYPGLDGTETERISLLKRAADFGITRIFTSLHIPETNISLFRRELRCLLQQARRYGMDVAADISPAAAAIFGTDAVRPQSLLDAGITTARLDAGMSAGRAALFSRIMNIQLNASTIRPAYVDELRRAGADFSRIDCLHNFYPRPHTGLGEAYFIRQTEWLHREGLPVGAFIPSQTGRRGPLYAGLPTLEAHRSMSADLAARHLAVLKMQSLFIGDPFPTDAELYALTRAGRENHETVVIKIRLCSSEPWVYDFLSQPFTARTDPARDIIRAAEGRSRLSGRTVSAFGPRRSLRRGDITIDNKGFLRYMGETGIILTDLPAENRTNIAAEILPEEQFLLSYITPGRPFRFEIVR